jgi:hypothetical protein
MNVELTTVSSVVFLCLSTGCQPMVVTPITGDPAAAGGTTTGTSSSSGSSSSSVGSSSSGTGAGGAGGASVCGGGVPTNPTVTIAATNELFDSIALDATSVYWGGEYGIWKVAKGGGSPVLFVAGAVVRSIAVNATDVYWVDNQGLRSVPLGGGTPTTLATSAEYVQIDAVNVYWTELNALMKVPLGGGTPTLIASLPFDGGILTVDTTSAYFNNVLGPLQTVSLAGGSPVTLASDKPDKLGQISVRGGVVYWGAAHEGLGSVPVGGGTVTHVGDAAEGVATDETYVYWSAPLALGYAICKMPLGGGEVVTLATGQDYVSWGIAVDETSVYWGIGGAQAGLRKTAK